MARHAWVSTVQVNGSGQECPLYTSASSFARLDSRGRLSPRDLSCACGLGLLHQAAGVGDQVGYFEGFYQAGDIFLLQEAAHFRFGYGGEGEQQMFLHAGTVFREPAVDFSGASVPLRLAVDDDGVERLLGSRDFISSAFIEVTTSAPAPVRTSRSNSRTASSFSISKTRPARAASRRAVGRCLFRSRAFVPRRAGRLR